MGYNRYNEVRQLWERGWKEHPLGVWDVLRDIDGEIKRGREGCFFLTFSIRLVSNAKTGKHAF